MPGGAGGTHESKLGAVLAPHIDYNYIEYNGELLHRRLNVLFYLNDNWQDNFGGHFEVHEDPRIKGFESKQYSPMFNRCIIMEISENSWHGYEKVTTPNIDITRKSISIYFFSKTRPEDQVAPMHSTFYIQKPIDSKFKAGYTLTEDDQKEIGQAVDKRDGWINFYQKEILKYSKKSEEAKRRGDWLFDKLEAINNIIPKRIKNKN